MTSMLLSICAGSYVTEDSEPPISWPNQDSKPSPALPEKNDGLDYLEDPFKDHVALIYIGYVISNGFPELAICLTIDEKILVRQRVVFQTDEAQGVTGRLPKEEFRKVLLRNWFSQSILSSILINRVHSCRIRNGEFIPHDASDVRMCDMASLSDVDCLREFLADANCVARE